MLLEFPNLLTALSCSCSGCACVCVWGGGRGQGVAVVTNWKPQIANRTYRLGSQPEGQLT